MNRFEAAQSYLNGCPFIPRQNQGKAFAPANIALIKYWGKRDQSLNLPFNDSLSLSMGSCGATTIVSVGENRDQAYLNNQELPLTSPFVTKIIEYIDLLSLKRPFLKIETHLTIPYAAGLASSAAGFAALILAVQELCQWTIPPHALSCLARLGSGSASRSLWQGFVKWHRGQKSDGSDCYAEPVTLQWPELRLGLLIVTAQPKAVSSREGMLHTLETSPLYPKWPETAQNDLVILEQALREKNFNVMAQTAEQNALAMHATMLAARPSLIYFLAETLQAMQLIWKLRQDGLPVYFTQDAGPNLKLLFLKNAEKTLQEIFPELQIIEPFKKNQ